jgi:hypothetical protein
MRNPFPSWATSTSALVSRFRRWLASLIWQAELASAFRDLASMRQQLSEARAQAETAEVEKEMLAKALERIRAHYETDISIQARIAAQGGVSGERSMG